MSESSQRSYLSFDSEEDPGGEVQFSPYLTVFSTSVCLLGFGLFLWSLSFSDDFRLSNSVSRDLERIASRLLSVESRLSQLSMIEQTVFRVWGTEGDTQEQIRSWYAELPEERRNPVDKLYLGILDGEAEMRADIFTSLRKWDSEISPIPAFRRLLEVGYLGRDRESFDYDRLQARLAEEVPANWFYFQLAKRVAHQSGDKALRDDLEQEFQQLTDPQLWKWRILIFLELILLGIGFLCVLYLIGMWFKGKATQTTDQVSERTSPWTFHEGLAVLARGGALSVFLIAFMSFFSYGINILENYGSFFLYFPIVILVIVLLCRPKKQSFFAVIGCKNFLPKFRGSFPILFGAIALGLMGDWLLMFGGESLGLSVHWTEWFLPQLVWGDEAVLLKITWEVVVLAPIFEEIIFRGIVFSTMRAKFGFFVSMFGSALAFALAHGYGPIAFLTIFWSGLLWAWVYERTGSVIPGICAHAINNGLVVYFLVAIFR